jgi:hypothetical protein
MRSVLLRLFCRLTWGGMLSLRRDDLRRDEGKKRCQKEKSVEYVVLEGCGEVEEYETYLGCTLAVCLA